MNFRDVCGRMALQLDARDATLKQWKGIGVINA